MMPLHYMRLLLLMNQTVRYLYTCTTWTVHAANQKGAVGLGVWPYSGTACPVSSHTYCARSALRLSGFMAAGHSELVKASELTSILLSTKALCWEASRHEPRKKLRI